MLLAELGWELATPVESLSLDDEKFDFSTKNTFTTHAWEGAIYGNNIVFAPLVIMWLLGYIKTESRKW